MMRFVTIVLAVAVVVLGVLAAHHAQATQGETSHAVLVELDTVAGSLPDSGGSPDTPSEHLGAGLVTGCIVLIACLTREAARTRRADVYRWLSRVAHALGAINGVIPAARAARPDLVALSISRT